MGIVGAIRDLLVSAAQLMSTNPFQPHVRIRVGLGGRMLCLVALLLAGTTASPAAPFRGVMHEITASVRADADSPFLRQDQSRDQSQDQTATLTAVLRISFHALESRFYGKVPVRFENASLRTASPEQTVWAETKCHHERGLPKVTVLSVDGSVGTADNAKATPAPAAITMISARARELGRHLPLDEVAAASALQGDEDANGSVMRFRARTTQSRLIVEIAIHTRACVAAE